MEKLRYGMVGGGPESFIGDAHRKAINIDPTVEDGAEGVKFVHACLRSNRGGNTWESL